MHTNWCNNVIKEKKPAVTYAAAKRQGCLFWISCKWLKLMRKASCLQVIKNSLPSVVWWRQCDIRIVISSKIAVGTTFFTQMTCSLKWPWVWSFSRRCRYFNWCIIWIGATFPLSIRLLATSGWYWASTPLVTSTVVGTRIQRISLLGFKSRLVLIYNVSTYFLK